MFISAMVQTALLLLLLVFATETFGQTRSTKNPLPKKNVGRYVDHVIYYRTSRDTVYALQIIKDSDSSIVFIYQRVKSRTWRNQYGDYRQEGDFRFSYLNKIRSFKSAKKKGKWTLYQNDIPIRSEMVEMKEHILDGREYPLE